MELFSDWMGMTGGGQAVGRYAHYLGGITWIGLLYFFNFIQGSAFAEMSDAARGEAIALIGSDGYLEIAVRDGSACRELGIATGAPVRVAPIAR